MSIANILAYHFRILRHLAPGLGVAAYSIVQLGSLSGTARAALDIDNRMMAYQETLTDAFLSEVRYAGRFLITRAACKPRRISPVQGRFQALYGRDDVTRDHPLRLRRV